MVKTESGIVKKPRIPPASETIDKWKDLIRGDVKKQIKGALKDRYDSAELAFNDSWLVDELLEQGYDVETHDEGTTLWFMSPRPQGSGPSSTTLVIAALSLVCLILLLFH